jgi:Family of unknown function (DUF6328)
MLDIARDHDDWNAEARGETPMQRADRAYGEILQEVRVAQTGVQILFAFLLALAFQARFGHITSFQRATYVVTLMLCAAATALLIAPAAFHRVIYRRRLKQQLVRVANRLALSGLMLLLLSLVSAVLLIMDVVLGLAPAIVLAAGLFAWFTMWWFVVPLWSRARRLAADGRLPDSHRSSVLSPEDSAGGQLEHRHQGEEQRQFGSTAPDVRSGDEPRQRHGYACSPRPPGRIRYPPDEG